MFGVMSRGADTAEHLPGLPGHDQVYSHHSCARGTQGSPQAVFAHSGITIHPHQPFIR